LIDALDSHDKENAVEYAKVLMLKAFNANAWFTLTKHTLTHNIMRYIPMSQYTFEEICEQCYNAINRPTVIRAALKYDEHLYNEIRKADEWCKELVAQ
jgi:hypothetical protein